MILLSLVLMAQPVPPGEQAVDPYAVNNANAGAKAMGNDYVFRAFDGRQGVDRIVARMIDFSITDPRISEIFKASDLVRLRRTLGEQFCFILGGGCTYTGRSMKTAHKDMGLQTADLNALVEHLQTAMEIERVPFWAQNRLLARLAPMKRDVVER
jgi:hemoglobin